MAQLRREYTRFQAAGLEIFAVGMGTPARTKRFRKEWQLPFPVLADPRRKAYQFYGLMRVDFRQISAHGAGGAARGVARHGVGVARYGVAVSPDQDMLQLGGVFIVDTEGIIRYAHRARQTFDNPSPGELLRAGAALRGG